MDGQDVLLPRIIEWLRLKEALKIIHSNLPTLDREASQLDSAVKGLIQSVPEHP